MSDDAQGRILPPGRYYYQVGPNPADPFAASGAAAAAPAGPPTVWYHGERSYSLNGRNPVNVSQEQHNFLRAFLGRTEALDTRALEKGGGVSNVAKVARKLAAVFGEAAIRRPGRSRKGQGYFVHVRARKNE